MLSEFLQQLQARLGKSFFELSRKGVQRLSLRDKKQRVLSWIACFEGLMSVQRMRWVFVRLRLYWALYEVRISSSRVQVLQVKLWVKIGVHQTRRRMRIKACKVRKMWYRNEITWHSRALLHRFAYAAHLGTWTIPARRGAPPRAAEKGHGRARAI